MQEARDLASSQTTNTSTGSLRSRTTSGRALYALVTGGVWYKYLYEYLVPAEAGVLWGGDGPSYCVRVTGTCTCTCTVLPITELKNKVLLCPVKLEHSENVPVQVN